MPRRRDGEVTRSGKISGEDLRNALFGRRRGRRHYDEETDETTITITGEEFAAEIGRFNPGPARRDGIRVQYRTGAGKAPEVLRFNRTEELRKRAGLSVEALADAAYLHPRLLTKIEAEAEGLDVNPANRAQIAAALHLDEGTVFPEKREGAGPADWDGGLPSLTPAPVDRKLPKPTQADIAEQHERQARRARDEVEQARNAEELAEAEAALRKVERAIAQAQRSSQAARQ